MLHVLDPVDVIMEEKTANNEGDTTDSLSIEGLSIEGEGDDSSLEGRITTLWRITNYGLYPSSSPNPEQISNVS